MTGDPVCWDDDDDYEFYALLLSAANAVKFTFFLHSSIPLTWRYIQDTNKYLITTLDSLSRIKDLAFELSSV